MRKTLKLDRNLTPIFLSDAHSRHPHPHFASRLETTFVQTVKIKLLNVTRTTIRRATVREASVSGAPFMLPSDSYETVILCSGKYTMRAWVVKFIPYKYRLIIRFA
jgi:hypothetical protein